MNRETENKNNGECEKIDTGAMACVVGIERMEREILPTVTLRGLTILPGMVIHFDLSREKSAEAVEQAMLADQRLLVVTQRDGEAEDPAFGEVYEVGTITVIKQVTKLPGHVLRVLVEGKSRGRLYRFIQEKSYILTEVSEEKDDMTQISEAEQEAMTRTVRETFAAYYTCFPKIGKA